MNHAHQREIEKLERLARLMDSQFKIPGTDMRMGLDGLLGFIPGIGDTATMLVSAYIIHKARQHGAHPALLTRMGYNVFIDWLVGLVPLVGDIFDVSWKANLRNVELLKAHLQTAKYQTDAKGRVLFI